MNVCFLLTHVPNPRMNKRIEVFKKTGKTTVVCARRASQNIWEPSQDVEHIIFDVDLPSARHILKRYMVSRKFQRKAMEKLNELKPDVIYAEGLDTLIIADEYKKKNKHIKIFFEVADLREDYIVKPSKITNRAMTKVLLREERKIFRSVDFLVVTSPKFYDVHYHELIERDKMLFIPNVPDEEAFRNYERKQGGRFTVGFIGGIRYLKQMEMLVDAAEKLDINVLFAGAGGTKSEYGLIRSYCAGKDNVTFTGKYDYDKEIAGLYGRVDCVYSVYDADNPNVRIALPNKFYESILCELPIIVSKGTYLAELVERLGVGVAVSHTDANELIEALEKLIRRDEYYRDIIENCRKSKPEAMAKCGEKYLLQMAESKL